MLCPFLLVTAMTSHRLCLNSTSFCFQMGFHIRDIPVTTVAGVGAMDRLSEFPFTDLGMATEAFGIVNTFIAILTSLDDKPLALFATFRRLGYPCGFCTLLFWCRRRCPEGSVTPKDRHTDGDKDEKGSLKHRLRTLRRIKWWYAQCSLLLNSRIHLSKVWRVKREVIFLKFNIKF